MTFLLMGFALGIAGSAHCLLMCGPLVLAAHGASGSHRRWLGLAAYHGGRLLTYEGGGAGAALAGRVLVAGGFRQTLSVVCGLILLSRALPVSLPLARPPVRAML